MNSQKLDPLASARRSLFAALAAAAFGASTATAPALAQEPIKIGFGVALTGELASSGKARLLSKQIWAEEINGRGGLLGRPVKLFYYDDQTNAATVPAIYAKLMDVDKVDIPRAAQDSASDDQARRTDAALAPFADHWQTNTFSASNSAFGSY
jgi:branched-chain amino acid transport system substrate-binding protein